MSEANRRYARKWRADNPIAAGIYNDLYRLLFSDKINARKRERRIRERDKVLELERAWIQRNKDKWLSKKRRYYRKHKDTCIRLGVEWARRNRNKSRAIANRYATKRRAAVRGSEIGESKAIDKIYDRAQELRQWFDVVVDHVIPLSKGGSHSPDNLQIIYRNENCAKNASLSYKPRVIFA